MNTTTNGQSGSTLPELLAVLAVMALTLGMTAMYLKPAEAPLQTGAELVEGYFRQARFQAMANTAAFRVKPGSSGLLTSETAASCSETTWTANAGFNMSLPDGVTMTDTSWTVCFGARGISNNNLTVTLSHPDYGVKKIEVLLGGTTQVL